MSPSCDKCDAHVSEAYYRVRKGNDGDLHGCPECTSPAVRQRVAAGAETTYRVRSTAAGYTMPADEVATDGGRE